MMFAPAVMAADVAGYGPPGREPRSDAATKADVTATAAATEAHAAGTRHGVGGERQRADGENRRRDAGDQARMGHHTRSPRCCKPHHGKDSATRAGWPPGATRAHDKWRSC